MIATINRTIKRFETEKRINASIIKCQIYCFLTNESKLECLCSLLLTQFAFLKLRLQYETALCYNLFT